MQRPSIPRLRNHAFYQRAPDGLKITSKCIPRKKTFTKNLHRITKRITFATSITQKLCKMTKITNLSTENLQVIATEVGGKLWQKGDKTRIYVTGGNNYHYDGKWYYEIDQDGSWESKCYLTDGYNNKNREDYVKSHLTSMDNDMDNALAQAGDSVDETKAESVPVLPFSDELAATLTCDPVAICENPHYNPRNTPVKYVANLSDTNMINHYHGCGEGYAYIGNGKVWAFRYGRELIANEHTNPPAGIEIKRVAVEFSCTQICFRNL
jgi:hypothetical protein